MTLRGGAADVRGGARRSGSCSRRAPPTASRGPPLPAVRGDVRRPGRCPTPRRPRWYLSPDGTLVSEPPTAAGTPGAQLPARPVGAAGRRRTRARSIDIWQAHPTYDWQQIPDGNGLGWITAAADGDRRSRSAPARSTCGCESPAGDTDLEVTLTEVRPDGTRDLHPVRLAARQPPQLDDASRRRSRRPHRTSRPTPRRCRRASSPGAGRAVPVRARLPQGLADADHRRRTRQRPAGLGVRHQSPTASGSRSPPTGSTARGSCSPSCRASTCPARRRRARRCAASPAGGTRGRLA